MKQAEGDAAGRVPVVMHCRSRQPWLVTMLLKNWIEREKTGENGT